MSNVSLQIQLNPTIDTNALKQVFASLSQALSQGKGDFSPIDAKQLQQELNNATKSIETFEKQFEGSKKQIEAVNQELAKSPDIASNFNKAFQFNQIQQAFSTLANTVSGLSAPFAALDTATQSMKTLGEEAALMAPNLRDAAVVMSTELPFAAADLQNTMFDALASGVKGGEEGLKSFAEISAKLATGGASSISDSTKLLAGQLNAYGKTAEEAGNFSDMFFNTVNLGVTSIPELSSTLANVIPTAASLGVEFENVGGALALMTSKGIPTAQSTTKLNALLIELAKPGAALAPILTKAGVSLESLKQDDLPVTLGKINTALRESGKASIEVFSSSEAGAAFATLAGDLGGFQDAFEGVRDTSGSAENAYAQMADSVEVKTAQIKAQFDALLIKGFDVLGGAFTAVAQAGAQIGPLVTSLGALGSIIPPNAIGSLKAYGVTLLNTLVPGLITTNATTGALTLNTNALSIAQIASAAKVKILAAAQWLLNVAMTANPVGLVVAGLVALGAVLVLAYNNIESFRNGVDTAFKFITEQAEKLLGYLKAFGAGVSALFKGENPIKAMSDSVDSSELERKLEKSLATIEEGSKTNLKIKADLEKSDNFEKNLKNLEDTQAKIKVITESDNRTPEQEKELEALTKKAQGLANAVGSVAKTAVSETKGAIDANGKYTEQLTINVEKAKEFAKAQKEGLNKDLVKNQSEVSNALIAQNQVYEEQKKKLDDMAKKAVELKNAGKNDEYEKQVKAMNEFGKEVDTNKKKLVDNFQSAVTGGTANDKAQKTVGKTLGLNTEQIKAMAETQKTVTAEVQKTGAAAQSLGDEFKKANDTQKKQFDTNLAELAGIKDKLKNTKNISKEERNLLKEKEKAKINETKTLQKSLIANKNITDGLSKQFSLENKVTEKKKETAIELYNKAKEELQQKFDILQLEKDMQLAVEGRTKNIFDDLQTEKEKKDLILAQTEALKTQFQIGAEGNIGIKGLKPEDMKKAEEDYKKQLNDLNKALQQSEIASVNITTKLKNEEIDDIKQELAKQTKDTEYNITIGLATNKDLKNNVLRQLAPIEEQIKKFEEQIATANLLPDESSKLAIIKSAQTDLEKLTNERTELLKKARDVEKKIGEENLADTLRNLDLEEKALKTANEKEKALYDNIVNTSKTSALDLLATAKERELEKLEEIYKRQEELEKDRTDSAKKQFDQLAGAFDKGKLSEEAYYRKSAELTAIQSQQQSDDLARKKRYEEEKQKIVEKAKLQELITVSVANGQILELERNRLLKELGIQKQRLQAQLDQANEIGDVTGAKKIQDSINDISNSIAEKGDIINALAASLQGDITDTLTNLFNGDPEQAKEGFKEIFAVIAGALKAQASAAATSVILGQLGLSGATTGFLGLLAVPAITALVNAGISKLLDPILNGLLSFSTGGRVDSPTLAMIGDASKSRAGADTEWVFRDDQINVLLYRVANEFNKSLFNLVDNLRDDNTYLFNLMKENIELSKFAVTPDGNVIDTQNDIINLALATALNTSVSKLDAKISQLSNYQSKLNEQNKDTNIDYSIFRQEFSILKSELLNKQSQSKVSNDLLKVVDVINNDNIIATIDNMKNEVVSRIDVTNQKLDVLTATVSNLQLSISQNDIYKANKNVEINRLSRART